ncbi:MAG: flagellar export protein FliJ [Pseudomonadota bacterium]
MMDPTQLDKVAVVARADESKAATVHQQRQQVAQQSQQRLGQLEQFRQEYETRLSALGKSGMDARQLADYRRFLSGLSDAISRQGDELQRDRANMVASQNDLREQSRRRMTVDELIAQTRAGLLREEERREQKLNDETSLQRHNFGSSGQ